MFFESPCFPLLCFSCYSPEFSLRFLCCHFRIFNLSESFFRFQLLIAYKLNYSTERTHNSVRLSSVEFCSVLLCLLHDKYVKRTTVSTESRVHKNTKIVLIFTTSKKKWRSLSRFKASLACLLACSVRFFFRFSSTRDDNSKENNFHTHQNRLLVCSASASFLRKMKLSSQTRMKMTFFTHLIFVQNEWNGSFKWKFGLES